MHPTGKSYWKDHSAAWKASNLTQHAYCEQAGISYRSFVYQHNRINKQHHSKPVTFIAAKINPVKMDSSTHGIQLLLHNGIRLSVHEETSDSLLQRVLHIAGGIVC